MQNDVKSKLAFLLREKRCCKFEVHFMFKGGTSLELEYDGKKNQESCAVRGKPLQEMQAVYFNCDAYKRS